MVVSNTSPLIASLKDEIEKLKHEAHFWISPPLYKKLLKAAEE